MPTINSSRISIIWGLASIFYAYQYIIRVLPNIMMPEIMQRFTMDASMFGQFSGIYYIGYAGMHIPIGIMLDRYGPKKILPICIFLTTLGILPLLYSNTFLYPTIGRLIIGIGSSAAILGIFKIIRIGFKEEIFTRMLGISVTIGLLGAIYGGQPLNYLVKSFGSEIVLQAIILIGIILAVVIYAFTPEYSPEKNNSSVIYDIKQVITNYKVIVICVLAGLMVGPIEGFADVWGTEFLKSVYGFSNTVSSSLPSFVFLGMCFGASLLSYVADKTKAYIEVIIISAIVMTSCFIIMLFGLGNELLVSILLILIGIMCAYQIPAIYKATTYVPENLSGITTALANMIIMMFGYIIHGSIGFAMNKFAINGEFTKEAFVNSISIIPASLLFSALAYSIFLLREKNSKRLEK